MILSGYYSQQYLLYIFAFVIIMIAQSSVQRAYNRYKQIRNEKGMLFSIKNIMALSQYVTASCQSQTLHHSLAGLY